MTYTDVFGNNTLPPAEYGYASFNLTTDSTFVWPYNSSNASFTIAKVMDMTCSAGVSLVLPNATEVSTGEDFMVRNVGSKTLTVKDASGAQVTQVLPGAATYFYLTSNATTDGLYGVIAFGVGTSSVDAASLVGYGVKAIGSSLNQSHPVVQTASSFALDADYRAKLVVFSGGAATFNLVSAAVLGDDYFTLFRNDGTGTVTLAAYSGDYIDGMASMQVQPGESLILVCTGTQWFTVGYGRSVLYQFTQLTKDVSAGGAITLTATEASNRLITFVGNPSSAVSVVVPATVAVYYTRSAISTAQTITLKTASGSGTGITQGSRIIALCDGTNVVSAQSAVANASVSLTDGSVSVPSLFFSTQTNTGLYKDGTKSLGVTVEGVSAGVFGPNGLQTSTIGPNSTQRHTLPAVTSDTVTLNAATQTLTNKTLNSPVISNPSGLTKADVGLSNVDNTTDLGKPISIATQAALDGKASSSHVGATGTAHGVATTSVAGFMSATDKSKLDGVATGANKYTHPSGDGNLHVPATGTTNSGKVLKAGATAGSLGWGTLDKAAVGLGNVDNTSDADKPVSTAQQTALNLKQNAATAVTKDSTTGMANIPAGTSGQRPASPPFGAQRANSTTGAMEWWNGTAWAPMGGGDGFRNKIINGNMQIAQRTSSGTAPINQYTPTLDRWIVDPVGGSVEWGHGGNPLSISGYPFGSLVATAGVGTTNINMRQRIESINAYMLVQKKVTVSFYVYGSGTAGATCTPSLVYANSTDAFSATTMIQSGNVVPIIDGTFTKYSFTFNTLPYAAAQGLQLTFSFNGLSQGQAVSLGGVQLEEGGLATPFEHRPNPVELAMCQRYLEVGQSVMLGAACTNMCMSVHFKQNKRVAPTVFRQNDWFSSNTNGSVISSPTPEGFTFSNSTVNATGVGGTWIAWAEL